MLVLAVIGPGFITASGGDDAGGVFTYSQAGRAVRLLAALDDDPDRDRARRRAGNGGPDGRGDGQGPERSHSRGVRLPV